MKHSRSCLCWTLVAATRCAEWLMLQPPAHQHPSVRNNHSSDAPFCFQPNLICSWGAPWGHRDPNRFPGHRWSLSPLGAMGFPLPLATLPWLWVWCWGHRQGSCLQLGWVGPVLLALVYPGLSAMARVCSLARCEQGRLRCCWSCAAAA